MNFKKIELNKTSTLNIIKTTKFKNIAIMVSYKGIVKKEDASFLMLLNRMLSKATSKYPSITTFASTLDAFYGAVVSTMIDHYGNINLFDFNSLFIDDKYLLTPSNLLEEQFKLLHEVIYNPLVKENKFDEAYFNERKTNYIQSLMSLSNNKEYQASRGIKNMFDETHPLHVSSYGYLEEAKKIENEALYQKYLEVINRPFDIYVLGDVEDDKIEDLVRKYFKLNETTNNDVFMPLASYHDEQFEEKVEKMMFNQSQLVQAYFVDIDNKVAKNRFVSLVFNAILGGGSGSSKLYNSVREVNGLAYSIYSQFYLSYNVLFVNAGISAVNYEKCTSLIAKELTDIQEGNITNEELTMAKNIYLSVIKAQFDSIYTAISFYQKDNLLGKAISIDDYVEGINTVTKEEIIDFAKKVKLIKQFLVHENKGGKVDEKDVL